MLNYCTCRTSFLWTSTHLNFTFKTSYSASILPSIVMSVKWDFEYQCWQCHNVTHNLHNERIVQQLLSDITDNEYDSKHTMFVCLFVCLFVCSFLAQYLFACFICCLHTYIHTELFILLSLFSSSRTLPPPSLMRQWYHCTTMRPIFWEL